jgi:cobalamin biosynthesis protein CobT
MNCTIMELDEDDEGNEDEVNEDEDDEGNEDEGNEDEGNGDEGNEDEGNEDEGNEDEGDRDEGNEDEGDEDEGDEDASDGSNIEIVDDGKIKPLASATQKVLPKPKVPAASHVAQKKPKLQAIDEEGSSSSEEGESTCRTRPWPLWILKHIVRNL